MQLTARPRRALVDDDALHRQMLGDALLARGFEVVTAADGAAGLRALADEPHARPPLTDACMPGMDGEAFVRTIREAGGETELAVVVVTGHLDPELAPAPRRGRGRCAREGARGGEGGGGGRGAGRCWSERARARHQERVRRGRGPSVTEIE